MKFAARILSQFSRNKTSEPDAFEKRLNSLGQQSKRRSRVALPSLFIRHANA
jgi:hypothetical protein